MQTVRSGVKLISPHNFEKLRIYLEKSFFVIFYFCKVYTLQEIFLNHLPFVFLYPFSFFCLKIYF